MRALEHKLRDIRAYVQREAAAIPQVEAVVAACQLQQQHLQHIAGHLPTYLPSLRSPDMAGSKENSRAAPNAAAPQGMEAAAAGPKKRPPAPRRLACNSFDARRQQPLSPLDPALQRFQLKRPLKTHTATLPRPRYIAASELSSVSSYMRGRLTADKVNAAIDELAGLAEANAAAVASARRNRAVGPDKKRAMWLAFHVGVRGPVLRKCLTQNCGAMHLPDSDFICSSCSPWPLPHAHALYAPPQTHTRSPTSSSKGAAG